MELQRVSPKNLGPLEEFFSKEYDPSTSPEVLKQNVSYRKLIYDFIQRPRSGMFKRRQFFFPFIVVRDGDIKAATIISSREDSHYVMFLTTKTAERGQGYASILLNYVLRNFPFRKIELKCKPELVKFYERFQFTVVYEDHKEGLVAMENLFRLSPESYTNVPFYAKTEPAMVANSLLKTLDPSSRVGSWEEAVIIINTTDYKLLDYHDKIVFSNGQFYNVIMNHLKNAPMISSKWNLGALSEATRKPYIPETRLLSKGMHVHRLLFTNGRVIVKPRDGYGGHGITIVNEPTAVTQDSICQVLQEPFLFIDGPFAKRKFDLRVLVYVSASGVFLFNTVFLRFTAQAYDNKSLEPKNSVVSNRLQGGNKDLLAHMSFVGSPIGSSFELSRDHTGIDSLQSLVKKQLVEILCDLFYLTEIEGQRLIEYLFGGVYTSFGIFGLDFNLNEKRELMLLEVNSNPGIFFKDKDGIFYESVFADRFAGSSLKSSPYFTFVPHECLKLHEKKADSVSSAIH